MGVLDVCGDLLELLGVVVNWLYVALELSVVGINWASDWC